MTTVLRSFKTALPWKGGPQPAGRERVLVSLIEFTPHRVTDFPAIFAAGCRLRSTWMQRDGAVGVSSFFRPFAMASGALSVWTSEDALRKFVGSPDHRAVMRRFRSRGTLRAISYWTECFDLKTAHAEAVARLTKKSSAAESGQA
jgi:hypothetical protein